MCTFLGVNGKKSFNSWSFVIGLARNQEGAVVTRVYGPAGVGCVPNSRSLLVVQELSG